MTRAVLPKWPTIGTRPKVIARRFVPVAEEATETCLAITQSARRRAESTVWKDTAKRLMKPKYRFHDELAKLIKIDLVNRVPSRTSREKERLPQNKE